MMHTIIRIIICFTFLLILNPPILAQRVVTFGDAVQMALDRSIAYRQSQNNQLTLRANRQEATGMIAPQISTAMHGWRTMGNQFIEQEARVVNDARTNNFYGTVDASLTVFNGMSRRNYLREAQLREEAGLEGLNRRSQEVIWEVAAAYLACLLSKELWTIAGQEVALQTSRLEQITGQVGGGMLPEADQTMQNALLKSAEVELLKAAANHRRDKTALALLLLLNPSESFEVEVPVKVMNQTDFTGWDEQKLMETAINHRPDLEQTKLDLEAASRQFAASKGLNTPSLSVFGSVNSRFSTASLPAFDMQIENNLRKEYGMSLNVPIFQNYQNRARYIRSKIEYENQVLQQQQVDAEIRNQVIDALLGYKEAEATYEATLAGMKAAEQAFALEEERFRLGITDLVQLAQASRVRNEAAANLAMGRFDYIFQGLVLEYALGILDINAL